VLLAGIPALTLSVVILVSLIAQTAAGFVSYDGLGGAWSLLSLAAPIMALAGRGYRQLRRPRP
jgi:hypothetical protein